MTLGTLAWRISWTPSLVLDLLLGRLRSPGQVRYEQCHEANHSLHPMAERTLNRSYTLNGGHRRAIKNSMHMTGCAMNCVNEQAVYQQASSIPHFPQQGQIPTQGRERRAQGSGKPQGRRRAYLMGGRQDKTDLNGYSGDQDCHHTCLYIKARKLHQRKPLM